MTEEKERAKEEKRAQAIEAISHTVLVANHDGKAMTFVVPSASAGVPYTVRWYAENENWHCSCDNFKYHPEDVLDYRCKHIRATTVFLGRVAK